MTSEKYAQRETRVENHYHTHYGDRYGGYASSPYYGMYIGGGYSPLFWYCMMDWSLERRAMWMYHNRSSIDQQLYQQELAKNAALQAQIAQLEASGTAVNPGYVDPEFADNPDLMYTDEYVQAVYNPVAQTTPMAAPPPRSSGGGVAILWVLGILIVVGLIVYFVFFHRWGE